MLTTRHTLANITSTLFYTVCFILLGTVNWMQTSSNQDEYMSCMKKCLQPIIVSWVLGREQQHFRSDALFLTVERSRQVALHFILFYIISYVEKFWIECHVSIWVNVSSFYI